MSKLDVFAKITKVDAAKRLVYASLATEAPDKTGEIFDYESSKPFVEKWSGEIAKSTGGKSQGNMRAMHGKVAAGKFVELTCDDVNKRVDVVGKVVDDAEWNKVVEGVYTGLSIGGTYVKKWRDGDHTRYTADPNEGSLVDLPCNPEATFVMIKADGKDELRKFHVPAVAPLAKTGPVQKWIASDGTAFEKKSDAEAHDAKMSDPAAKLSTAVASLAATVKKAESLYDGYETSEEASEMTITLKDITDLPEIVRAAMADDATAEVFRVAYNKAKAQGMGDVEALDDAWGSVTSGSEKTADGKYHFTGELLPFTESAQQPTYPAKAAGIAPAVKAGLEALMARSGKPPSGVAATATVGKRDFSQVERDKAADAGDAMPDGSFPIKSKTDLANAVKAFGRAKNKAAVKAHIIQRAKDLGAEDSLPDAWKPGADKAVVAGALRKGLYAVARLASLIEELEWFQQGQEMEAATEGDGSENPAQAKQVVAAACALLRNIVEEETNELLSDQEHIEFGEMLEMAHNVRGMSALAKVLGAKAPKLVLEVRKAHNKDEAANIGEAHSQIAMAGAKCAHPPEDNAQGADGAAVEETEKMAKGGMRHSAADQAHLDSAHDHLDKMGYCGPGAAEKMAKAMSGEDQVHLDSAHDHLSKMGIGCGMSKAGARHSAADLERLNKAHDCLAKAGASCPTHSAGMMDGGIERETDGAKSAKAVDLVKSLADKNAVIDRLEKGNAEALAAVEKLTKAVEHILKQEVPDPARRTYRVVSKTDDDAREAQALLEKARKEDPRGLALALIGDAMAHPIDVNQVGRR